MEKMVELGKAKAIGVSNWNVRRLKELLTFAKIKPAVNQVELHPYLAQVISPTSHITSIHHITSCTSHLSHVLHLH